MSDVEYKPTISDRLGYKIRDIQYRTKKVLTSGALKFVVWLHGDSNLLSHVHREVPEWFKEDGPNRWIADGTVELLAVLSHQNHSGSSAGYAVQFFGAMAMFKPWTPLTGEDDEWTEIGDGQFQNRRCSHVFKNADGAYDIDGKVFHDGEGVGYTNYHSRVPVEFPYTVPDKPEYIDTTA